MKRFISDERIDVVFGFGGFGSSAAMAAAGNLGVRCGVLNPDAVPGKANRLFARWADDVFVQWAMTGKYFKRPVHVVGCPVRQRIKNLAGEECDSLRETGLRKFDLNGRMRTVFVMGGSTGARSVNRAVVKTLDSLADDVQVLHMTGHNDFEYVKGEYSKSTRRRHRVVEYIERVDLALAAADLVVARAGAVALAELIAAGVPSILMPYPYDRQKHQRANAQVLVEAGGAVMVDDDGEAGDRTVGALADALADILGDERRLSEMSEVLKRLTRRDADEEIARWLLTT